MKRRIGPLLAVVMVAGLLSGCSFQGTTAPSNFYMLKCARDRHDRFRPRKTLLLVLDPLAWSIISTDPRS